jgi:hypothetical protein
MSSAQRSRGFKVVGGFAAALGVTAMMGLAVVVFAQENLPNRFQGMSVEEFAEQVVGPDDTDNNCLSCHALEYEAWQQTRHFATFQDIHSTDEAKAILEKMGDRSMKRSETCIQCHYTPTIQRRRMRPAWGVTCESCHGPAADWVLSHAQSDGKTGEWGTMKKNETPEQRAARLEPCVEDGMIHSTMSYDIAANCFGCHTVPNEELVNKGGHPAGSAEFDLVAWSQGEVRHNFASSAGAPNSPSNAEAPIEQRRKLYTLGALVDLEMTLRNLASVKEPGGTFHVAMLERAQAAQAKLAEVVAAVELPGIAAALEPVPAELTAETAVDAAWADALREAGRAFSRSNDGSALGALDDKLPTEYRGSVHKE